MHLIEKHVYGPVTGYEFGYAPIGRPLMSVFAYAWDGILIDSGQPNMRKHILDALSNERFSRIVLTHAHEDHSGNALALASSRGCPIIASAKTVQRLTGPEPTLPYQRLVWGARPLTWASESGSSIETSSSTLIPIETPGHANDHTVYLNESNGILFSGDLFIGTHIAFFRRGENIVQQIRSIRKVLDCCDFDMLLCAHRPRECEGKEALAQKLDFLENLFGSVARVWSPGMRVSQVMRAIRMRERWFIRMFTMGDVSTGEMVRSAVHCLQHGERP